MSKNLLIFALFAVLLVASQAKALKKRQSKLAATPVLAQTAAHVDCTVYFTYPGGGACETIYLNDNQRTAKNDAMDQCNDAVQGVLAVGKCSGCSIVLWEDYGFNGQYLAYNLDAKRDVKLDKYHFINGDGAIYTKWSNMLSGYQAYC